MNFLKYLFDPLSLLGHREESEPASCPVYEVCGQGENVLLIPGLGSSPAVWSDITPALKTRACFHSVTIAGFAGQPLRDQGRDSDPVQALVEDMRRYTAVRKLEPVTLIGHSMGGLAAMYLALKHPELVRRVMVIDTLPFYPLFFNPLANVDMTRVMAEQVRATMLLQDEASFIQSQQNSMMMMARRNAHRQSIMQDFSRSDRSTLAASMHSLMTRDIRRKLPQISCPVTVVYPTHGLAPELHVGSLFRNAWSGLQHVQFVRIEDSCHFVMYDQPEALCGAISGFLGEAS